MFTVSDNRVRVGAFGPHERGINRGLLIARHYNVTNLRSTAVYVYVYMYDVTNQMLLFI